MNRPGRFTAAAWVPSPVGMQYRIHRDNYLSNPSGALLGSSFRRSSADSLTSPDTPREVGPHELTVTLWRERGLCHSVLTKYWQLQTPLETIRPGAWRQKLLADLASEREELHGVTLWRDIQVDIVGELWGAPRGAGLRVLPDYAPSEVWGDIFRAHRYELERLSCDLAEFNASTTHENRLANPPRSSLLDGESDLGELT